MVFEAINCNPNGDPDLTNAPRQDIDTNHGLVSDVCLKNKMRNRLSLVTRDQENNNRFIKADALLNEKIAESHCNGETKAEGKQNICNKYLDIRLFGAVISTKDSEDEEEVVSGETAETEENVESAAKKKKDKKEQKKKDNFYKPSDCIRGPVQVSFAKSVDPITVQNIAMTRQAITNEKDAGKTGTFGRKDIVPYGLYVCQIYINANDANKSLLNETDLQLFFDELPMIFETDRSAARSGLAMRKLYVFKHESKLFNCPTYILEKKISIKKKADVDEARCFEDYEILVDTNMPTGVTLSELIEEKFGT